jgi:type II secretory pathway pseudopilin PulG
MEVLEHTPKPTRRGPIVVLVVAAALILLILGAVAVDDWQRERESLAVQTAYAEAVATIETAQTRVRGTVAYASPLLQVGPADVRAALEELVLEEVDAGRTEFARARQALSDTSVWPWHDEVLEQRAALVADLDDRARSLTEATGQGLFVP